MLKLFLLSAFVFRCLASDVCDGGHCGASSEIVLEKHGDVHQDKEVQVMIQARRVDKERRDTKVRSRATKKEEQKVEFFDFVDGTVEFAEWDDWATTTPPPFSVDSPRVRATCEPDSTLKFSKADRIKLKNNKALTADTEIITFKKVLAGIDLSIIAHAGYRCGNCPRNGVNNGLGRINLERATSSSFTARFSSPVSHDFQLSILDFDMGRQSSTMREKATFHTSQTFGEIHGDEVAMDMEGDNFMYTSMTAAGGENNPNMNVGLTDENIRQSINVFLPAGTQTFDFDLEIVEPGIATKNIGKGRNFFIGGATVAACS